MSTHLPSHSGTIRVGRIAERGERITCKACQKQIEHARREFPGYVDELLRNLQPGYVEEMYVDAAARNASLAKNALHYFNLSTFEGS